jgi:hypothetical protein
MFKPSTRYPRYVRLRCDVSVKAGMLLTTAQSISGLCVAAIATAMVMTLPLAAQGVPLDSTPPQYRAVSTSTAHGMNSCVHERYADKVLRLDNLCTMKIEIVWFVGAHSYEADIDVDASAGTGYSQADIETMGLHYYSCPYGYRITGADGRELSRPTTTFVCKLR